MKPGIRNIDETNMSNRYRDIIIQYKGSNKLKRIFETHRFYDPLHYVLLFPSGAVTG